MDKAERTLAFEIQFWGLIAPLIPLMTLFVILLKMPSQGIYLSLASIIGFLAAWKWKRKGVLVSLSVVLLSYLYQYSEITPDEHLWHLGMNASILLGFFIAGACFEEVEKMLAPTIEQAEEVSEVNEDEIAALKSKIVSYENFVEKAKDEISKINLQNEKLLKEFFQKQENLSLKEEELFLAKSELKKLGERVLNQTEETSKDKLNFEKIVGLERSLEEKGREITELKLEIERLQEKIDLERINHEKSLKAKESAYQLRTDEVMDWDAYDQLKNTNELLSRERGRLESLLFRSQMELNQKIQDFARYEEVVTDFDLLKMEKDLLLQTIQEAEYREADLENRIYELAKERESFYRVEEERKILLTNLAEMKFLLNNEQEEKKKLMTSLVDLEESLKAKEALIEEMEQQKLLEETEREAEKQKEPVQKEPVIEWAKNYVDLKKEDPAFFFDFRKIEGKYAQLREQFEEKAEVLNATRRELFKKEETILALNLQLKELEMDDKSEREAELEGFVMEFTRETEEKIKRLTEEVESLQEIIQKLSE